MVINTTIINLISFEGFSISPHSNSEVILQYDLLLLMSNIRARVEWGLGKISWNISYYNSYPVLKKKRKKVYQ